MVGGNFRLDALQAAVLNVKLKYLDGWSSKRRQNASHYDKLFANSQIKTPKVDAGNISIYNQYTIAVAAARRIAGVSRPKKKSVLQFIILCRFICRNVLKDFGYKAGDLPVTERCCKEVLSLPVYPELIKRANRIRRRNSACVLLIITCLYYKQTSIIAAFNYRLIKMALVYKQIAYPCFVK